ncbi:hypothetical protein CVT26_015183 [Gymnopilus dilepis]|uniref:Uncharacterized protein n=1 Tax=Gymnopilus dilepis TaxID=231916 RepID=A0A409WA25_9AGAR|nr:hypothetical protein CVT26_015183 [Gymnopilus dilepis]
MHTDFRSTAIVAQLQNAYLRMDLLLMQSNEGNAVRTNSGPVLLTETGPVIFPLSPAPPRPALKASFVPTAISGSNMKSVGELERLVSNVLLAEDFDQEHLDFNAERELGRLDSEDDKSSPFSPENGWKTSLVRIPLPAEGVKQASEAAAPMLEVPVCHRSLLESDISSWKDESSSLFHLTPFKMFWKHAADSSPERVVTELYNSDAMIEEHEKVSNLPLQPGSYYETVIAAFMLWSDSTHLANFGIASLWPIYLFFGNQSKYSRSRPTDFAAHHIAYIPSSTRE